MTDKPEDKPEEENEIMAAARIAKERQKGAEGTPEPAKLSKWGMAALGAGVGSAAVAAAVLYANRNKKR